MKKGALVFMLLFISIVGARAQDTLTKNVIPKSHFFSIGGKHWGIGFGKSPDTYSGLKFNVNNRMARTNGINLSLYSQLNDNGNTVTNGINVSLLYLESTKINGIAFSPVWMSVDKKMNGLFVGGVFSDAEFANGIGLIGLFQLSDQLNGFFLSGIDLTAENQHGVSFAGITNITDEVAKGVVVSGIYAEADTMKGLLIGGVVTRSYKCIGVQTGLLNFSWKMQGVQFGMLNTIKQNPKWCRTLPVVNFHFKKYVPRVDSIFKNDTLIVKKYQIDNTQLKSTASYLISGKRNGNWKTMDVKGRIILDDFYRDDRLVSKKKLNYPGGRQCIVEIQNDSFSQHMEITRNDTTVLETTVKGKTKFRDYDGERKTYYYHDTLNKYNGHGAEVYAGKKSISFNTFTIKYGDTLSGFSGFEQFVEQRHGLILPLIKKDSGVYIIHGKVKGLTYRNRDSSITRQEIYYNKKFNKIRSQSSWTIDAYTLHTSIRTFYRNGKLKNSSRDYMDTTYNKKGEITRINFNIDDDQRFEEVFKNGKLRRLEKEAYLITYYSNGNIKWEHAEMESAVYSRYYRKNGSLKIESCAFENADYYYSRSGKLKYIKRINKNPG